MFGFDQHFGSAAMLLTAALAAGALVAQDTAPAAENPAVSETPAPDAAKSDAAGKDDPPVFRGTPLVAESGTKREKEVHRTPDAIGVVSREEIGKKVVEDLGDAFRGQPGIFVQRTAAGQASPFVRGMTGKRMSLLIDGVRFNNAAFRSGPNQYFGVIDPWFTERLEVVRGPFSVLYGSDAMGGAVNVISRRPKLQDKGEFRPGVMGQYTSANKGRRVTADAPFSLAGAKFAGYASLSHGEYGDLMGGPGVGLQPFTSYSDLSGTAGATFDWKNGWSLDFRATHRSQYDLSRTDQVSTVVANPTLLPLDGNGDRIGIRALSLFPKQEDSFSRMNLKHEGEGTLRALNFGASWHRVYEGFHRQDHGSTTRREQYFIDTTYGFTGSAVLDFGAVSRITAGFDFYHDEIEAGRTNVNTTTGVGTSQPNGAQFPSGATYSSLGLYAQDEIVLFDGALELRPGLRFSMFQAKAEVSSFNPLFSDVDKTFTDVTGAISATWRATDILSPNISIGRGFRAPNLDDLAASKSGSIGSEIPNPDVDPEVMWGAQAGLKVLVENTDREWKAPHHFRADGFVFGHWMEDALIRENTTFEGNNVFRHVNGGRARIWGWETSFSWYVDDELSVLGLKGSDLRSAGALLSVHGAATWNHGDDLTANEPFDFIQPFIGTLGVRYDVGDWFIEPSVEVWSRADRQNSVRANDVRFAKPWTPGFTLFHVQTGWNLNDHAKLRLAVNNIGNKNYQQQGSGTFGSGTDVRLSLELRW